MLSGCDVWNVVCGVWCVVYAVEDGVEVYRSRQEPAAGCLFKCQWALTKAYLWICVGLFYGLALDNLG
jgi:hypothetical protein